MQNRTDFSRFYILQGFCMMFDFIYLRNSFIPFTEYLVTSSFYLHSSSAI